MTQIYRCMQSSSSAIPTGAPKIMNWEREKEKRRKAQVQKQYTTTGSKVRQRIKRAIHDFIRSFSPQNHQRERIRIQEEEEEKIKLIWFPFQDLLAPTIHDPSNPIQSNPPQFAESKKPAQQSITMLFCHHLLLLLLQLEQMDTTTYYYYYFYCSNDDFRK